MQIFIVSLSSDTARRNNITKELGKYNLDYQFVDAVFGKAMSAIEYYKLGVTNTKRTLSPSELGCSLSHIKAIKYFISSGDINGIILEDDVIIKDPMLLKTFLKTRLIDGTLYILGGQEGLRRARLLRSIRKNRVQKYNKAFSYFFQRTCCYAATSKTFKQMLNYLEESSPKILADDWPRIAYGSKIKKIEYWPVFEHPKDLSQSHIENERLTLEAR